MYTILQNRWVKIFILIFSIMHSDNTLKTEFKKTSKIIGVTSQLVLESKIWPKKWHFNGNQRESTGNSHFLSSDRKI